MMQRKQRLTAVNSMFSSPTCCKTTSGNDAQRNNNSPSFDPLHNVTNATVAELTNGKKLPTKATNKACTRPRSINSARAFNIFIQCY